MGNAGPGFAGLFFWWHAVLNKGRSPTGGRWCVQEPLLQAAPPSFTLVVGILTTRARPTSAPSPAGRSPYPGCRTTVAEFEKAKPRHGMESSRGSSPRRPVPGGRPSLVEVVVSAGVAPGSP